MPSMPVKSPEFIENPETQFWQECRQRAEELGIPAWLLAEEGFVHERVDTRSKGR
jgi:hypothetical protein